jgi:hypothetical protein
MSCCQCGKESTRIVHDTATNKHYDFCKNCPAIPVIIQTLAPGKHYYPTYNDCSPYTSVLQLKSEWIKIQCNSLCYQW